MSHWNHPNGNEVIFVQSSYEVSNNSKLYALDITADSIYVQSGMIGAIKFVLRDHIITGNHIVINQGMMITKYDLLSKFYIWQKQLSAYKAKKSFIENNGF